jgi:hypothetical protein
MSDQQPEKIKPVHLIGEPQRERLLTLIECLPLGVYTVTIKETKKNRSESQSGLRWFWVEDISNVTGETKLEVNHRLKKTYLLPIFEKYDKGEYRTTMEMLRELYRTGERVKAIHFHNQIVNLMRTEEADVDEMAEYLRDIEREAIAQQITLRRPGDYDYAIGAGK